MSETDKETILSAIQTLSERIDGSFSEIRQSLTDIEQRLGMQESKSRNLTERQSLQEKGHRGTEKDSPRPCQKRADKGTP